jgi:hypothetical protein
MKKTVFIALVIFVFAVFSAGAQLRLDVNVSVPVYWGFQSEATGTLGDVSEYTFILPEVDLYYQFDLSLVKLGIGVRLITFIVESVIMPDIFIELHLDPIILRASLAGGAALFFGLYSETVTGPIIVPDVNVMFKLAEFFRVGGGICFIADFNDLDTFIFIPYVGARFTFVFGGEEKKSE